MPTWATVIPYRHILPGKVLAPSLVGPWVGGQQALGFSLLLSMSVGCPPQEMLLEKVFGMTNPEQLWGAELLEYLYPWQTTKALPGPSTVTKQLPETRKASKDSIGCRDVLLVS